MSKRRAGGRPPKYTKAQELQKKIEKYFDSCYKPVTVVKDGKCITLKDSKGRILKEQYKPFTITGLADALDMSRQSLLNYGAKEEFFDTITRAKRKCEIYAEERLYDRDGSKGAIFSLSNNFSDWKTKQEVSVGVSYEDYIKRVEDEEEY